MHKYIPALIFVISGLLTVSASAATCDFPDSEPLEGKVAVVGLAVDSERARFKVHKPFKGREEPVGGGLATLNAELVRHYDEIYEKTYLKRGGKFSIGPFKFGKSREFTSTVTKKNYTATFMLMFEVKLPDVIWEFDTSGGTPLTEYAETLLDSPCEFKRIFGDSFISQTKHGARVYVAINLSFSSDLHFTDYSHNMDASLELKIRDFIGQSCNSNPCKNITGINASGFSLSAAIESEKNNISAGTIRDGKIEIIAMQLGGDVSRLGQIFGSGSDVTLASCQLSTLENCDLAFNNVLAYLAQEEFAEGVKAYPAVLDYSAVGYWEVDTSIPVITELTPKIEASRTRLAETLLEREQDLIAINVSLATSLSDGHRQQLEDLQRQLDQDLDNLTRAGFTCFSDLANCVQKGTQVLADLKAYDRAVVNPNPADGLVAYYPFNANVLDESGNGNDGVVYGATLTANRTGEPNAAYSFKNSNITISNEFFSMRGDFSIYGWFNSDNILELGNQTIINTRPHIGLSFNLNHFSNPGRKATLYISNSGDTWTFHQAGRINYEDNKWYQFAIIKRDSNIIIYGNTDIDQIIDISNDNFHIPNRGLIIGDIGTNDDHVFNGLLDDIRIYNRALTDAEIQQIYTATGTNINQPPLAIFTTQDTAPLTVTLDATDSNDADGSLRRYEWQSSDGQTTNGQTATLSFANPGEYRITLTVTDDQNATSQAVKNITVQAGEDDISDIDSCTNGTINDCRARYSFEGKLCVPCVMVPSIFGPPQIFALDFNQKPFTLSFGVNPLTVKSHSFSDACAANYSFSGLLSLPCVDVDGENYQVEMQQRPGGLVFDVSGVR